MKLTLHLMLALSIVLLIACSVRAIDADEKTELEVESRSGTKDKVSARIHPHFHHHHAHHAHHALHHGHHFAHHHPILTKKLLLLKFKAVAAPHLAHHLHHSHLHHSLFHHHHHPFHPFFRASSGTGSDSVVEVIPINAPTGSLGSLGSVGQSGIQLIGDSPTVQTYSVPSEYLQPLSEDPEDTYEAVPIEDVSDISPLTKHSLTPDGALDQEPVYLYAVQQPVELGRAVNKISKNRRKFKN